MTDPAAELAQMFHDYYERLAPEYGYRTRDASAKPWAEVPAQNRGLMTRTARAVLNNSRTPDLLRAWDEIRPTYPARSPECP
jgi:hypothetical protein